MLTKFQARKKARAYHRTKIVFIPSKVSASGLPAVGGETPSSHPQAGKWVELDYAASILSYRGKRMIGDSEREVKALRKERLDHQRDAQEAARVSGNWAWLHRWNPASGVLNSAQAVAV